MIVLFIPFPRSYKCNKIERFINHQSKPTHTTFYNEISFNLKKYFKKDNRSKCLDCDKESEFNHPAKCFDCEKKDNTIIPINRYNIFI